MFYFYRRIPEFCKISHLLYALTTNILCRIFPFRYFLFIRCENAERRKPSKNRMSAVNVVCLKVNYFDLLSDNFIPIFSEISTMFVEFFI